MTIINYTSQIPGNVLFWRSLWNRLTSIWLGTKKIGDPCSKLYFCHFTNIHLYSGFNSLNNCTLEMSGNFVKQLESEKYHSFYSSFNFCFVLLLMHSNIVHVLHVLLLWCAFISTSYFSFNKQWLSNWLLCTFLQVVHLLWYIFYASIAISHQSKLS